MDWKQGWAVMVKTKRKGSSVYFARFFKSRQGFWAWKQPRYEILRTIQFGP